MVWNCFGWLGTLCLIGEFSTLTSFFCLRVVLESWAVHILPVAPHSSLSFSLFPSLLKLCLVFLVMFCHFGSPVEFSCCDGAPDLVFSGRYPGRSVHPMRLLSLASDPFPLAYCLHRWSREEIGVARSTLKAAWSLCLPCMRLSATLEQLLERWNLPATVLSLTAPSGAYIISEFNMFEGQRV